MNVQRPLAPGLGWALALLVLIVAVLSLLVAVTVPHLATWLVIGLCVAVLLG
jgi:hypothetical protein